MKTSWELTGDTLEKLRVKVTLDATGKAAMNTPPIYRVELVGDWKEQKDIVLAKEDVLLVSGGSAGATFSDLPSYLAEADNIRLRSGMHLPVLDRSIPTIRWKQVITQLMSAN